MIYYAMLTTQNIKIGCSVNLVSRIRNMPYEYCSRETICILGVHDGEIDDERKLHRKFHHLRVRPLFNGRRYGPGPEDFRPERELIDHILRRGRTDEYVEKLNVMLRQRWLLFRSSGYKRRATCRFRPGAMC